MLILMLKATENPNLFLISVQEVQESSPSMDLSAAPSSVERSVYRVQKSAEHNHNYLNLSGLGLRPGRWQHQCGDQGAAHQQQGAAEQWRGHHPVPGRGTNMGQWGLIIIDFNYTQLQFNCQVDEAKGALKPFTFNVVFEPEATQEDVLEHSGMKRLMAFEQ